ncbi:HD domain-containing protein [Sphaerobacter thermophilus]|uniref:Metal dependent phosphohydrolase n=1 Tax=Sphaerobacter thermophilus (strain ATCC 49802 / DSM 20745 / KCCM 41009 / NCIMB 13125 / S 6022) TaxID=479434 RepID=D1C6L8_SPHTD|nr:HD domain-containing protein [Sphaerobacter thermophilus]ACZ39643.1 metal dependent phosphohydrolase [Sphaerobacter thermophilus DSM 20745]
MVKNPRAPVAQIVEGMEDTRPQQPEAAAQPSDKTLPVKVDELARDPEVQAYIEAANANLGVIGFTEHGTRHANLVSRIARNVLRRLDYDPHLQELAAIAGYLHDMGNAISRYDHALTGALLAREILLRYEVAPADIALVMGAIGSHGDDSQRLGEAVHPVSAALILADKSDVHRSRVRASDPSQFDAHDRVNWAVESSFLRVDPEEKAITLELTIDTSISQVMDYFEIFLPRMIMCRRAAELLGCQFHIQINGVELL